jgi:hypothetical protein
LVQNKKQLQKPLNFSTFGAPNPAVRYKLFLENGFSKIKKELPLVALFD